MFNWLKKWMIVEAIRQLDQLEEPIALKIEAAQKVAKEIPPRAFAKELVDAFQNKLYDWAGVAPKDRPKEN